MGTRGVWNLHRVLLLHIQQLLSTKHGQASITSCLDDCNGLLMRHSLHRSQWSLSKVNQILSLHCSNPSWGSLWPSAQNPQSLLWQGLAWLSSASLSSLIPSPFFLPAPHSSLHGYVVVPDMPWKRHTSFLCTWDSVCLGFLPCLTPGFHLWLLLILQGIIVSKTSTKWSIPSYHHNAVFILTTSFSFCNFIYISLSLILAVLRAETGFASTAPCTLKYLNTCLSIEWWVYLKGQSGDE